VTKPNRSAKTLSVVQSMCGTARLVRRYCS
jgi:hypothetical protein